MASAQPEQPSPPVAAPESSAPSSDSPGFVFKDGGFLYAEPAERSPTLEDAWRRFADYDKNAGYAQKAFIQQRKWITSLGVASTTLAVLFLVLEVTFDNPSHPVTTFLSAVSLGSLGTLEQVLETILRYIVIVLPIVVTVLLAASIKFNMGANWIMLRSSAETLKKEIYRYRTQVDIYDNSRPESRDVALAQKIKVVGKRVMETQVNQSGLSIYDGELPPPYGAARSRGDDGFSDLTPELYLTYRLEDQFDYYRRKAEKLGRELTRLQWSVYTLGGVGTLLAAVGLEVWVAVSSSFAAALASFLEFKRVETNLISCNTAASDLYDIRSWWRALPEAARHQKANIEALVNSTEQIIQGENASWVQEMRDALAELYGDQEESAVEELESLSSHGTLINVRMDDEAVERIVGDLSVVQHRRKEEAEAAAKAEASAALTSDPMMGDPMMGDPMMGDPMMGMDPGFAATDSGLNGDAPMVEEPWMDSAAPDTGSWGDPTLDASNWNGESTNGSNGSSGTESNGWATEPEWQGADPLASMEPAMEPVMEPIMEPMAEMPGALPEPLPAEGLGEPMLNEPVLNETVSSGELGNAAPELGSEPPLAETAPAPVSESDRQPVAASRYPWQ